MNFLTVEEVAQRLKVSLSTVKRWIRDGELAPLDLNAGRKERRLLRVSEQELQAFVTRGAIPPPPRRQPSRPKRARTTERYV